MIKLLQETSPRVGIGEANLLLSSKIPNHQVQPIWEAHGVKPQRHGKKMYHGECPKFSLLQLPKLLKDRNGAILHGSLGHLQQHHLHRGRSPISHGMSGALGGSSE